MSVFLALTMISQAYFPCEEEAKGSTHRTTPQTCCLVVLSSHLVIVSLMLSNGKQKDASALNQSFCRYDDFYLKRTTSVKLLLL